MAHYLDTSALVKLLFPEKESAALKMWISRNEGRFSTSRITVVELNRLTIRADSSRLSNAGDLLDACDLIDVSRSILHRAGTCDLPILRTLDAIHLASALSLGSLIDGVVTYDIRLADACAQNGIRVVAPD